MRASLSRAAAALLVGLLAAPQSLHAAPPAVAAAAETTSRTAAVDGVPAAETLRPPFVRAWTAAYTNPSLPIIAEGRAFLTFEDENWRRWVVAHDVATGRVAWGPVVADGSRLAYDSGRVFVLAHDGRLSSRSVSNGELEWTREVFDSYPIAVLARAGVVYAVESDYVHAISASTGAPLWSRRPTGQMISNVPAVDDTGIYLNEHCGDVESWTLDGQTRWYHYVGCGNSVRQSSGQLVLHGGRLYDTGDTPRVFDAATGDVVGTFPSTWVTPAFAGNSMLHLAGGNLRSRDLATAAIGWTQAGDGTLRGTTVVANGLVYTGSDEGRVYGIDVLTGHKVWEDRPVTDPFVDDDIRHVTVAESRLFAVWGAGVVAYAEPAVSVSGPPRTQAGRTETIQVHAPPGSADTVHFRRFGASAYTPGASVTTDEAGRATVTWRFDASYAYYATTGALTSRTATTRAAPIVVRRSGAPATAATAYLLHPHRNSLQTRETIGGPLVRAWHRDFPANVSYPLVVGGRVFVTTEEVAADGWGGRLYALDLRTGSTLWGPVPLTALTSMTTLAYGGGRVYANNSEGLVRVFDAATGAELGSVNTSRDAPPATYQGDLFVSAARIDGTRLSTDWAQYGPTTAPAVDATGVHATGSSQHTFGYTLLGEPKWHYAGKGGGGGIGPISVVAGGRVYVRSDSVYLDGAVLDASTGERVTDFVGERAPVLHGSYGYFVRNGSVYAAHLTTHVPRWTTKLTSPFVSTPIVANGRVYAATANGYVHALDQATGRVRWSGRAGASVRPAHEWFGRTYAGNAVAEGRLVVAAGTRLTTFTQPVTVAGPASAPAGSTVTITATAWPGAAVTVYLRPSSGTAWRKVSLRADSAGRAKTTFTLRTAYSYYAAADGLRSPVRSTRVTTVAAGGLR